MVYCVAKDKEFDFAATFWLSAAHTWRKVISAGKISCFSRAFLEERCAKMSTDYVCVFDCSVQKSLMTSKEWLELKLSGSRTYVCADCSWNGVKKVIPD